MRQMAFRGLHLAESLFIDSLLWSVLPSLAQSDEVSLNLRECLSQIILARSKSRGRRSSVGTPRKTCEVEEKVIAGFLI
jgi:hypothetical protein